MHLDHKIVGLAGAMAVAAPGMAVAMPASVSPMAPPQSYADLLTPIPNAVEQLKVSDAVLLENQGKVELAQYYYHHHHHHFFHRRFYHHHHHFFRHFYHHHHHHFYRY